MFVPYKVIPDRFGQALFMPMLRVQISLPVPNAESTPAFEAMIDSGASRSIFHADFAAYLGLNLEDGLAETANGVDGPVTTWLHRITLRLPGGTTAILAGFKEGLPFAGLLGMHGFFDQFRVTFDPVQQGIELERVYAN